MPLHYIQFSLPPPPPPPPQKKKSKNIPPKMQNRRSLPKIICSLHIRPLPKGHFGFRMGFAYIFRSLDCITPHFVSYLGGEEREGGEGGRGRGRGEGEGEGRGRGVGMGKREVILGDSNRFFFIFILFYFILFFFF